jgi:hypothetical protein
VGVVDRPTAIRHLDATVLLFGYELVLLLVARGFPLSAAAVLRARARLPTRCCRRGS